MTALFAFSSIVRADEGKSAPPATQAPPTSCNTPREATDSVFAWLQPERYQPRKAALCLDSTGRSRKQLQEVAEKIKEVFDQRALYIDMAALSDEPQWEDPTTHKPIVAPDPRLPGVFIERQSDGQWRWTSASLDHIEELHADSLSTAIMTRVPKSLRREVLDVELWQYLAIVVVFLAGLLVGKLIKIFLHGRARHTGRKWMSKLAENMGSPGATVAMAVLLRVAYPELGLPIRAALVMSVAVRLLFLLALVWTAYRLVDFLSDTLMARAEKTDTKLDDQLIPLLRKSLKVVVVIAGGLVGLQNLDVDVGSLLAGLGLGGLAFALAAKDTIANFFGSIMIFADRPFQIGDWIVIKGAEGIVEEVGFRSTRVRAFDNSLITIPNAGFTETMIHNYGARVYRRCYVTLNVTYDTTPEQMQAFVEGIRAIILAHPQTRKDYYEIHMSGFGAHSLDIMVYFFFKVPTWSDELREKHNVFLEIMRLARDLGVDFAFPTQTLHVDHVAAPGQPRKVPAPKSIDELAEVVHSYGPKGKKSRPAGPTVIKGALLAKSVAAAGSSPATDEQAETLATGAT
ncbi:MAG: mechanosensitive ion channel family protein [Polyangiaceae bacterium]